MNTYLLFSIMHKQSMLYIKKMQFKCQSLFPWSCNQRECKRINKLHEDEMGLSCFNKRGCWELDEIQNQYFAAKRISSTALILYFNDGCLRFVHAINMKYSGNL